MRRKLITLVASIFAALTVLAVWASPAMADSPHYVKGPTATVEGNSLVVSWKAAGLGNTVTSVDFTLAGTVTTSSQCFTKSGNPVNGVPKSETVDVNATGTFPVRNGQVTGSLTVAPISTLTCTGNQQVRILSATFDLTLTGDDLPPVHLTG
jgi:type V secretory pathway adhesin AidA